jgi:hypothetical protein
MPWVVSRRPDLVRRISEEDFAIMSDHPTEQPPVRSNRLALSESGSAHAPFLYFEDAPTFGHLNGIIRITLEATRLCTSQQGEVVQDRVVVAHLRMNMQAALSLKAAIEGVLLLANPATSESRN